MHDRGPTTSEMPDTKSTGKAHPNEPTSHGRVWTESFRVRSYEADPSGRASILSICNYLQEAAGNHATDLGVSIDQMTDRRLTWMLARLRVEIDRYPSWRDEVVIETWPSGTDRLYAMREFIVKQGCGSEIARASSAWLMIDLDRRRPVRLPEFVTALEVPDRSRPLAMPSDRLPDVSGDPLAHEVRVRHSDLDMNGHVNNVLYAEWSIESVPAEILESSTVRMLDLEFRAESNYGDTVEIRTARVGESADGAVTFVHGLRTGERGLARARTVWTSG